MLRFVVQTRVYDNQVYLMNRKRKNKFRVRFDFNVRRSLWGITIHTQNSLRNGTRTG